MTTVTVRPVATLKSRLAIVHGSAPTIDAATADDDDTTFVRQTAPTANAKVQFAGFTVPQGAVIVSITPTLRMRCDAPANVTVSLNGGDPIPLPISLAAFESYGTADQGGWSNQSVQNGISIQWTADAEFDVAAAYLDITYLERPVVEINTPAGTVTTSQPEIDWDVLSALPQSNYQVKIFTQDQYLASGFQPTDSAAFFDSGVQSGTTDSLVPTSINLVNGQTYREYVRAAQFVNSAPQWSAWVFITRTMNAPVPAVPAMEVTPDDALARIKIALADNFTTIPGVGYGLGAYGTGPYGGNEPASEAGATGPGSWQFVTVQRTSDGGVTWDPVRSATRAQVFGDTFVVYDYESCNGSPVQYRAQAIAVAGAGDVASDWSIVSEPTAWSSALTWLKSPTFPIVNTPVRINSLPTLTRRQPQTALDVEGRDDPVVVSDTRKRTQGTVTFVTLEGAERDAINVLLNRSETLLLQTPPEDDFGCKYVVLGDEDENRISGRSNRIERLIVCPFIEVIAPAGDIVGIGATWQLVADRYTTWAAVEAANVAWSDLLDLTG